jgi:NADH-quinone oxidoreductase subunit H
VEFGFWLGNLLNIAVFVGKCWLLVLVMMWMRWSLPRLRIDQVMMTCLKYFLPISCILLVGVCLWQLLMPAAAANVVRYILAIGTAVGLFAVFVSVLRPPPASEAPPGALPGAWEGQPVTTAPKK